MAVMGVANSAIDVAMNVQGVELERRYGRPLLSGLHSAHSFGVVAGGVGGTLCAARAVPLTAHFVAVAGIALVASQLSMGALLRERREGADHDAPCDRESRPGAADDARRARRRLVAIGLLASGAFFVEGAASDWSAIELRTVHGAGPGLASAAFTTFSLALALSRLGADRLVARHGRARFTRAAASVAAIGAGTVVVSGSAGVALIGWAVVGSGVAGIAPTLLGAAPGASAAPSSVAHRDGVGHRLRRLVRRAADHRRARLADEPSGRARLARSRCRRDRALRATDPQRRRSRSVGAPRRGVIAPAVARYYDPTSERLPARATKHQQISVFPSSAASASTRPS
jgi:hypothetical protein